MAENAKGIMNDLEWDYEDIPYAVTWSFNTFMEEYNRIYGFLNIIQGVTFDTNNLEAPVKDIDELSTQLDEERPKYDELINCGKKMSEKFPFLADDILCRVELLAVKWEILQIFVLSQRPNAQNKDDELDLGADSQFSEKCFHDWLSSVEDKIVPVKFKINWSAKAIKQKKNEMKIIQEDIVSQGQIVRSLIKSSKHREESKIRQLEDRWHKVWLRCLEWQCLLEGLGSTPKDELAKFDRSEDSTYDVRSVATETEMNPMEEIDDETMATKDPSKQDPKIGGDASDSASCDASDENSSVGNRSSDESEDGDDVNETIRESDVANPHPGIDGNKEVEIIEFWDQESYLSEHHYDEPRIDDSSLNMLNFGDDYRNYIDSLSEDENDLDDIPRRPRMPFGLVTEDPSKKPSSVCDLPPSTGEDDLSIYTEAFKKSSLEFRRKKEKVLPLLRSLEQCKVSLDELNSAKCVCKESELELTALRNAAKSGKECMLLSGLISRWTTLCTCIEDGIRLGTRVLETCQAINNMKMSLHQMLDEDDEALEMEFKHYAPNLMKMQNEIFTLNISLHEIIHELQSVVSLLERRAKAPRVEFQKIQQKMLELYSLWEQVHQRFSQADEDKVTVMDPTPHVMRLLDNKVDDSGISETSSCGRKNAAIGDNRVRRNSNSNVQEVEVPNNGSHSSCCSSASTSSSLSCSYPCSKLPSSDTFSRTSNHLVNHPTGLDSSQMPSASVAQSPSSWSSSSPPSPSSSSPTTSSGGRPSYSRVIVKSILQVQVAFGALLALGQYLEPQCCDSMCPLVNNIFFSTTNGFSPPL